VRKFLDGFPSVYRIVITLLFLFLKDLKKERFSPLLSNLWLEIEEEWEA